MLQQTTSEPPVEGAFGRFNDLSSDSSSSTDATATEDQVGEEGAIDDADQELAGGWSERQWLEVTQRAYTASTAWFEASVQAPFQRNYAHFQSRHAPGSKYLHDYYKLRSQIFRPKTRSMVRRSEAAAVVALFSTADLLDVDAWDDTNPDQKDAAEIIKAIIQYRFDRSIPWYLTVAGAMQEAAIHGSPIAHIYWRMRKRTKMQPGMVTDEQTGELVEQMVQTQQVIEDRPVVDLVPVENIRVDPAADWRDPLNASPYLFHRMSMFVGDVKSMINSKNDEFSDPWYRELSDDVWWSHATRGNDPIRQARDGMQADPLDGRRGAPDAELVWITRCFFRKDETDYTYDVLGTDLILCTPRPVEDVYHHLPLGKRPYVKGTSAIEAHKVYPTSPVGMVEETQKEINEQANLQVDATRMAILSRWIARRGAAVDIETLKYGAANSVVVTDDVDRDVKELKSQDVPQSAFLGADRTGVAFDEVAGNFSLASVGTNRQLNETVGGMNLLSSDAGQVKEYEIRTFVETWVEPVINHVLWLEQTYETDEKMLKNVAARIGLPIERVVQLVSSEQFVKTNVGFGTTSPEKRIQRIALGVKTVTELAPESQAGINTGEIVKEVFGALGFKNGARFYTQPGQKGANPEVDKLKQQVQQLMQQLQGRTIEANARIKVAEINSQTELHATAMQIQSDENIAKLNAALDAKKLQLDALDRQIASNAQDMDRQRLANERDQLSNEIKMDQLNFFATLLKGHNESQERQAMAAAGGGASPGGRVPVKAKLTPPHEGAPVMHDEGQSGPLSRDRQQLIPFAEG